jgi:hypothetical protein
MFFYSEAIISPFVSATGGTVNDIIISGITYRVHKFTSNGSLTFTTAGTVEYLIVGGGGASGGAFNGIGPAGSGGSGIVIVRYRIA